MNQGSRSQRESLKAALPFQAETQLSATVLAGGSGVSWLHRASRGVYMCTATWMTSRGAARCCFACGCLLRLLLARSPHLHRGDSRAGFPALLSWVPAGHTRGCPKIGFTCLRPRWFSLPPRWLGTPPGLLGEKVLSGAGCCSVQGTPSSSPTLLPLQAELRADHGNTSEVSACSSLRSSALLLPPDGGAVVGHSRAWASAGGCSVSPSAKSSCWWSPTSQRLFIALAWALVDISLELNKQAAQFTLAGVPCQQCQTVALLKLFQATGWNPASPLSRGGRCISEARTLPP